MYLRAEILASPEFKAHNEELLDMISQEITNLSGKGFFILLIGDFNALIGNEWQGTLKNNSEDTNYNGQLVKNFIRVHDLVVLYDIEPNGEVFTREGRLGDGQVVSRSCLDLCLVGPVLSGYCSGF